MNPISFEGALILAMADPLAEALGALRPGETFRYTYGDAVKLCGHSCPTVARAFLMTAAALRALYPNTVPVRGEIEVTIGGRPDDGSTGPAAAVVSLLTGAAAEAGFGGIMGKWSRKNMMSFDPALKGRMIFRRRDSGTRVEVGFPVGTETPSPELPDLLAAVAAGRASGEEGERFRTLWQSRVETILATDPEALIRRTETQSAS